MFELHRTFHLTYSLAHLTPQVSRTRQAVQSLRDRYPNSKVTLRSLLWYQVELLLSSAYRGNMNNNPYPDNLDFALSCRILMAWHLRYTCTCH
jgi:hypothetical protein